MTTLPHPSLGSTGSSRSADTVPSDSAPASPCFVSSIKGYFSLEESYPAQTTCTSFAFTSGHFDSLKVFDAPGKLWRVRSVDAPGAAKRGGLGGLLGRAFGNPMLTVAVRWAEPTPYRMDDLRQEYLDAVDLDDDTLTQFVEADELKRRILAATSFAEMMAVYEWAATDHDE
jgi:hypothetical protein